MIDKDAETLRNLEDAARQLLAAEAEKDGMFRYGYLDNGPNETASANKRWFEATALMHATLTPTGQ